VFQAEDGIRDFHVTGVQTCALPILQSDCRAPLNLGTDVAVTIEQIVDIVSAIAGKSVTLHRGHSRPRTAVPARNGDHTLLRYVQIGRASCRGRGWSSVAPGPEDT